MKRQKTYNDLLRYCLISFLLIGIAILSTVYVVGLNDKITQQQARIKQLDSLYNDACRNIYEKTELNWSNVDFWLAYFNVQHPDIVKKQMYLETGNLTSEICRFNNNLYGMRLPKARQTAVAYITMNGYPGYSTYIESIRCYSLWQEKYYKGGDYYSFLLRSGYATDTAYICKLKNVKL